MYTSVYFIVTGGTTLKDKIYDVSHNTISEIVKTYGVDFTKDHLKKKIGSMEKDVALLREKVIQMKTSIQRESNSDAMIHLSYDIEDAQEKLDHLLAELTITKEQYECLIKEHK